MLFLLLALLALLALLLLAVVIVVVVVVVVVVVNMRTGCSLPLQDWCVRSCFELLEGIHKRGAQRGGRGGFRNRIPFACKYVASLLVDGIASAGGISAGGEGGGVDHDPTRVLLPCPSPMESAIAFRMPPME